MHRGTHGHTVGSVSDQVRKISFHAGRTDAVAEGSFGMSVDIDFQG